MRVCNPHPKRLIRSWLLGLEKRRILLHAAGPLASIREENSRQRVNQETWNWSSRKSHWSWRQDWSSLIRNIPSGTRKERDDKWPRKRCQRDAGGDGVDRNSSSNRRRLLTRLEEVEPYKAETEFPRLDTLVTSSEEARMSQLSILVEDGGNRRPAEPERPSSRLGERNKRLTMESPCRKRRGDIVVQGKKSMMGCHDPEAFWMRKRLL